MFFFFQAEDGIRDHCVTGVQTCALPILPTSDSLPGLPGKEMRNTGISLTTVLAADANVGGARILLLDVSSPTRPADLLSQVLSTAHAAVLRYAWTKQQPPPGLLSALEQ